MESKPIKTYKGTDKDMKCRGFQFEIGKTVEDDGAIRCGGKGFHSCEAPLDVFNYYPPNTSRYFECEAGGEIDKAKDDDTKLASSRLTLKAEIGIAGLVKAHIEWVKEKIGFLPDTDTGYAAKIGSSGDAAQIGSSGDDAKIGSSGRYAQIGSSGDDASVICEADHAVVACVGKRGRCKAPVGTWITLAEYGEFDGEGFPCVCVKSFQIDGDTYKPDTWYTLKDGKIVEVEDGD